MHDYSNASAAQLKAWLRQYRKSELGLTCEYGHPSCGCSNVASMDGNAPCIERVMAALEKLAGK